LYTSLGLPPPASAKVISYTRFSSKRQAAGHSKERQDDKALKWCREHGYELDIDASVHDPGFSAYSAAHINRGELGVLQRAAIDGKLKNTVLLVEAFDRLSRLPLTAAYELLLSLVNNGVTVVTLTDGKPWNSTTLKSLEAFMLSLVTLYRGHEESQRKSVILREKFDAARTQGQRSAFGSAPGWLSRETKESPWTVDEKKADVVRKVFQMSADGYGSKAICKRAVEEGWTVPTRKTTAGGRWHARMPGIILRNRAVLGVHEHRIMTYEAKGEHWQGKSSGLVYHDYYPRIVSDELWAASRASIETRRIDKRRDTHYYNIFSGLMYCGYCGAPMHRRTEIRGYSRGTIACADKVSGHTTCPSGSAVTVDAPLLEAIFSFKPAATIGDDLAREIAAADADMREKEAEVRNITDTITKVGPLDALTDKLKTLSFELDIYRIAREALLASRDNMYTSVDYRDGLVEEAISKLYVQDIAARDYRASLHLKLARLVETVWVWNYEVAIVQFKHTSGRIVVPLDFKRLPSRANTLAKWHKPPPPKSPPPRPHLDAANRGELAVPTPRRALAKPKNASSARPPSLLESELPLTLPLA